MANLIFPTWFDEKTTIAQDDYILMADSEDNNRIKKAKYSFLKWEKWDKGDWTWDVLWPNSSTDWHLAVFDGATWKLIKDGWAVTIPNNATLTIQKNSTTIDTFTADASVDKTIDIPVPTKTSDIVNDNWFTADVILTQQEYDSLWPTPESDDKVYIIFSQQ